MLTRPPPGVPRSSMYSNGVSVPGGLMSSSLRSTTGGTVSCPSIWSCPSVMTSWGRIGPPKTSADVAVVECLGPCRRGRGKTVLDVERRRRAAGRPGIDLEVQREQLDRGGRVGRVVGEVRVCRQRGTAGGSRGDDQDATARVGRIDLVADRRRGEAGRDRRRAEGDSGTLECQEARIVGDHNLDAHQGDLVHVRGREPHRDVDQSPGMAPRAGMNRRGSGPVTTVGGSPARWGSRRG